MGDPPLPETPPLSVVIGLVNPPEHVERTLAALAPQAAATGAEVIVVSRLGSSVDARLARRHPFARVVSRVGATPLTRLRAHGLRLARGALVAVTEDHCTPPADWIERFLADRPAPSEAVAGVVENGATERLRDWAAFLAEYADAMPPLCARPDSPYLPTNNVVYGRDLVPRVAELLEQDLWEWFLYAELLAAGRVRRDAMQVVRHDRRFDVGYYVSQRWHLSRSYAAMRTRERAAGRPRWILATAALPALQTARTARACVEKRRNVRELALTLPLLWAYFTVGAVGELVGYVTGGGRSLERVE
jgi:hypothetical protein